jgi:hypothetical protein
LQPIDAGDDSFWDQFWSESVTNVQDVFTLVPAPEIRALREEAPSNLATLCYKAVEKLVKAVDNSCRTQHEQQTGKLILITKLKVASSFHMPCNITWQLLKMTVFWVVALCSLEEVYQHFRGACCLCHHGDE